MRTPGFFLLAAAALCLTAPAALRAQDHDSNPQLREVPDDDAADDEREDPAPVTSRAATSAGNRRFSSIQNASSDQSSGLSVSGTWM